jgi:phospholipid transport system transporter-binding protein
LTAPIAAFRLVDAGPRRVELLGDMTFATAAALFADLEKRQRAAGPGPLEIVLDGIERSDSAGLAILIEALSIARSLDQRVAFVGMPRTMEGIARISELEDLLKPAASG